MSDNYLRLILTDPGFVPGARERAAAEALLRGWLPEADEVTTEVQERVEFVDQGGNFEGVFCPVCRAELALDWWQEAMDRASATRFSDLRAILPCCCDMTTSLNDLHYEWPAGFARFTLEAMNPGVPELPAG